MKSRGTISLFENSTCYLQPMLRNHEYVHFLDCHRLAMFMRGPCLHVINLETNNVILRKINGLSYQVS